ncbi:MAG: hypothetical protein Q9182_006793 [Xanthomendoza sp. 2 TL-2023]
MYNEAAAVLWKGKEFDRLVRYLIDKRNIIPETVLQLYGIRCKIPLKQNKLSPKNRKEVISLLGSPQEREELLWQYEIYDVLEDLFAQQRRFNDLFKLKLRRGNLEGALHLLSSKPVAEQVDTAGDQVDRLIDYTMTSKIVDRARRQQPITQNLLPDFKAVNPGRHNRIQDWKTALKYLGHDSQSAAAQHLRDQLLWLNRVFCGLTSLYNRRMMSEQFQRTFLSIRRFWLERLLRELTWVSAYDQDAAMLSDVLLRLRSDHALRIVASEVEALILYRLKNEWRDKREYSALLEQLQLATGLGILNRFSRVLSHITHSVNQGRLIWSHINVVKLLEADVAHPNVSVFNDNITTFVTLINDLEIEGFMSYIKNMFERLRAAPNMALPAPSISLLNLRLSGTDRDNAEEFMSTVKLVNETMNLLTVNQPTLTQRANTYQFSKQIVESCARYKGKNPLVLIRQDPLSNPHNFPRTIIMNMDKALALRAHLPHARGLPQHDSQNSIEFHGQTTPLAKEAVQKLQSWWRVRSSLQRYLTNSFDVAPIVRFKTLMAGCPPGVLRFVWRLLFIRHGFNTMKDLTKAQDRCVSTRASVMSAMNVSDESSVYDQLDQALIALNDVESSLKAIADTVSHIQLHLIIKDVKPLELRTRFDNVRAAIQQADGRFKEVEAVVKEAHKK